MNAEEQAALLKQLSEGAWFASLPLALRKLVLSRSRVQTYGKGQVVSLEDSPPKGLFAVLDGQVHLVRALGAGEEALFHVGEPGFWFGELAVLRGDRTAITAIANTKLRLLLLPKHEFDRIVEDEPRYYRAFAQLALGRFAALLDAFVESHGIPFEARLRRRLAALARLQRQDNAVTGPIVLGVTQADLARMVGVSRQTLNGLLGKLQQEGLIETRFRRIRIVQPNTLAELPDQPARESSTSRSKPKAAVPNRALP